MAPCWALRCGVFALVLVGAAGQQHDIAKQSFIRKELAPGAPLASVQVSASGATVQEEPPHVILSPPRVGAPAGSLVSSPAIVLKAGSSLERNSSSADANHSAQTTWTRQGEQGETGEKGHQGVQGGMGPPGPPGADNYHDDVDLSTIEGPVGPVGLDGLPGDRGLQGKAGEKGPPGALGNTINVTDAQAETFRALLHRLETHINREAEMDRIMHATLSSRVANLQSHFFKVEHNLKIVEEHAQRFQEMEKLKMELLAKRNESMGALNVSLAKAEKEDAVIEDKEIEVRDEVLDKVQNLEKQIK